MEQALQQEKHYNWIDWAKIIGIYLVVVGHGSLLPSDYKMYIYSFHMPFFFMLSGLLYKKREFRETLLKTWKSLLVPYFIISGICLSYYTLVDFVINHVFSWQTLYERVGAILMGLGGDVSIWKPVSQPLWFVISLLFIYLMMSMTKTKIQENMLLIFSVIMTILLDCKQIDILPPVDSSFMALPFFYAGYKLKCFILDDEHHILLAVIALIMWCFMVRYNGRADIAHCVYGNNICLFYIIGLSGSLALILWCRQIKLGEVVREL